MNDEEAYLRLAQLFETVERWGRTNAVVQVHPKSQLASDDALTDPYQSSHAIAMSIGAALDHLLALRALVVDAGSLPMAAPFTLARAALENAAQALWVLAPPEQTIRVKRRLQMAVADARERDSLARTLREERYDPSDLPQRLERFRELAERANLPPQALEGKFPSYRTMVREAGSIADVEGGHLQALWQIGSGYAHGQSWSFITAGTLGEVARNMKGDVGQYRVTADVPTVFTITSAAFLVLNQALILRDRHRREGSALFRRASRKGRRRA